MFVTGRVDDMIVSGGENVSPVEIESILSSHPAVAEVAVAGLPDERWGQRITAFVKRSGRGVFQSFPTPFARASNPEHAPARAAPSRPPFSVRLKVS